MARHRLAHSNRTASQHCDDLSTCLAIRSVDEPSSHGGLSEQIIWAVPQEVDTLDALTDHSLSNHYPNPRSAEILLDPGLDLMVSKLCGNGETYTAFDTGNPAPERRQRVATISNGQGKGWQPPTCEMFSYVGHTASS